MTSPLVPVRSPFWWVRWVPAALIVAAFVAFAVIAGSSVLVPLIVSFALTFMLEPLVDWFHRRKLSRALSVLLAMTTAVIGVLVLLGGVLPLISSQLQASIQRLPEAIGAASSRVHAIVEYLRTHSPEMFGRLQTALEGVRNDPSSVVDAIFGWLRSGAFGLVNVGSAALGLLIVPFFVYYLLLDMHAIRAGIDLRIPERFRPSGVKLFDEIGDVVRGYVRGRFLVAAAMAVIYAVGLMIFGVPLAVGIGIIAGLAGIVPYLGVLSGVVLALGFALIDGAGPLRLAGVIGVFVVAQLAEDYMLTPRLIGDRLELHPMLVFIALIIAGDLFGLLGLVLAIPVLAVCKVILRFVDEIYLRSDFYVGPSVHLRETPGLIVRQAVEATTSHLSQEADAARTEADRENPSHETGRVRRRR